MSDQVYPVILSGGTGTRLWPVSRAHYPKHFMRPGGGRPMIVRTAERVARKGYAPATVVGNNEHRFLIAESFHAAGIEVERILLEPVGRNTAPAAAVAAVDAIERNPEAVVLLLPADHLIRDADAFHAAIDRALPAARRGLIVAFGVAPSHPHRGYGYIERGDAVAGCEGVDTIRRFIEKPGSEQAAALVSNPLCCWNAGIFLFRAGTLVGEMRRHAPEILAAAQSAVEGAVADLDFVRIDADAFAASPSEPLDTAVMEKSDRAAVVSLDTGWSDVGSWSELWEASDRDADGNAVSGDALVVETRNSLVHSEDGVLTAVTGVEDMIVVTTDDAVLVTAKDHAQDVKELVAEMARRGRAEHHTPTTVHRPWGSYRLLDRSDGYLVKRITVNPGACISLQYHDHRAEHWIVLEGEATVTRGGETFVLRAHQSTDIPKREIHRIENRGRAPVCLIEVQTGDLLSEDDIVRLEDRYGRGAETGSASAKPVAS